MADYLVHTCTRTPTYRSVQNEQVDKTLTLGFDSEYRSSAINTVRMTVAFSTTGTVLVTMAFSTTGTVHVTMAFSTTVRSTSDHL